MAAWVYRADKTLALKLRSLIEEGGADHDLSLEEQVANAIQIMLTVKAICEKLKRHEDIKFEMERLITEIDDEYVVDGELWQEYEDDRYKLIEVVDYFLDNFFDYCDGYRIWVEL